MDKDNFKELLERYGKGQCTEEEIALLDAFLQTYQEEGQIEKLKYRDGDRIFAKTIKEIEHKKKSQQRYTIPQYRKWTSLAAAVALVLTAGAFLYKHLQPESTIRIVGAELAEKTQSGETRSLELADKTIVELNEETILLQPSAFDGESQRFVQLQGEAYFDVTKDSSKPFIIETNGLVTKVLGTSFNIDASPDESTVTVSLVEGTVEIINKQTGQSMILSPGEEVVYNKNGGLMSKQKMTGNGSYAWREDIIWFERAPVQEVAQVLALKYGVTIDVLNEKRIRSLLVYKVDPRSYSFAEIAKHINKVTDYQIIKKSRKKYEIRVK